MLIQKDARANSKAREGFCANSGKKQRADRRFCDLRNLATVTAFRDRGLCESKSRTRSPRASRPRTEGSQA